MPETVHAFPPHRGPWDPMGCPPPMCFVTVYLVFVAIGVIACQWWSNIYHRVSLWSLEEFVKGLDMQVISSVATCACYPGKIWRSRMCCIVLTQQSMVVYLIASQSTTQWTVADLLQDRVCSLAIDPTQATTNNIWIIFMMPMGRYAMLPLFLPPPLFVLFGLSVPATQCGCTVLWLTTICKMRCVVGFLQVISSLLFIITRTCHMSSFLIPSTVLYCCSSNLFLI